MSELQRFRAQVNDFMKHHPQSPLDPAQQAVFEGLRYYDENDALSMIIDIELLPPTEPMITMETSTGDKRPYRRYGIIHFTVNGEPAQLTIYSDLYGHDFFLPFRDATSGKETYGAGRYLDNHRPGLQVLPTGKVQIDLNFAYNPYCAYSEAYSCPLPPRENWLEVPIEAGEKDFK